MNLATDFRYFAISVDRSQNNLKHRSLKYEYGGVEESQWINLYPPEESFHKELKKYSITFEGQKLKSYIRLWGKDLWLITEIDFEIAKNLMRGPFQSFDRETLQPFHFYSYKNHFLEYDSIYNTGYSYNWSNSRPFIIYIEPKEEIEIDTQTFYKLCDDVNKSFKGHFEERFLDFFSTAPSSPGHFAAGARIFLHRKKGKRVDERLSKKSRRENDGVYLPDTVRYWIDYINDIQELHAFREKWGNFRFPMIHGLDPKSIHLNNIDYAENLSLECLIASQEYHQLSHDTETLMNYANRHHERFLKLLEELADSNYHPSHVATLRYMVQNDYKGSIAMVKDFDKEQINIQLSHISNFVSNFFSITSTKENIKLQKKVFYLSIVVFVLAIITVLFATLNKETVISRIIDLFK